MTIDGRYSFDPAYVASKTKADFVKEFKGYDHFFPGDKDRESKLEAIWTQAKTLVKQEEPEQAPAAKPKPTASSKPTKSATVGKTNDTKAETTEPANPTGDNGNDTGN